MNRTYCSFVLLAALVVAAIAPDASAAALGTLEVNAGYSKDNNYGSYSPNGTLGGGMAFGAGYYWGLAPMLSCGIDVALENLGSSDFTNPLLGNGQVSAKAFRINPALRINLGAPVGPSVFGQVGAGLYNVKSETRFDAGGRTDESQAKFGANFGAGVGFPVGPKARMTVFGQGHTVATDRASTLYFGVKAGLGVSI